MSNQDVASAFFKRYFEILGIEDKGKVYDTFKHGGKDHIASHPTLADYLTTQTTTISLRDDVFNAFASLIASGAKLPAFIAGVFSASFFEEFQKAGDIDVIKQLRSETTNEEIVARLLAR